MSRRLAALLIGASLGVLVVAAVYLLFLRRETPADRPVDAAATGAGEAIGETAERWTAELYFPTLAGKLVSEHRELAGAGEVARAVEAAVAALLAGPQTPGLLPAFPPGLEVRRALVSPEGIAYVDLGRTGGGPPPASGSEEEMLRVYALVHTVTASVPEARQVVLLWDGEQRPSLAGHVDTGSALAPDPRFLPSPP